MCVCAYIIINTLHYVLVLQILTMTFSPTRHFGKRQMSCGVDRQYGEHSRIPHQTHQLAAFRHIGLITAPVSLHALLN